MSDHEIRLAQMEGWYETLIGSGEAEAERQFLSDYAPHADALASLAGRIVDIGGGAGAAARFLRASVEYVVVDPSPLWLSPEWRAFSKRFRSAGPEPRFVTADAEALPFADGEFDGAISFWALNHMRYPKRCLAEMTRVLCPGAIAYLVLEDVPPTWFELLGDAVGRIAARVTRRPHRAAIQMPLLKAFSAKSVNRWPLQSDHIRITDRDLRSWAHGKMSQSRRAWTGGYRTYQFVKR